MNVRVEAKTVAPVRRLQFTLTPDEKARFKRLFHWDAVDGEAFYFWGEIADDRGVDLKSIIATPEGFSALPLGHGMFWCWPLYPRKCKPIPTHASHT